MDRSPPRPHRRGTSAATRPPARGHRLPGTPRRGTRRAQRPDAPAPPATPRPHAREGTPLGCGKYAKNGRNTQRPVPLRGFSPVCALTGMTTTLRLLTVAALLFLLAYSRPVSAQSSMSGETLRITRAAAPIRIDGDLSDDGWRDVAPVTTW